MLPSQAGHRHFAAPLSTSLHYLPNLAAAVPAGVFLFPLLFSFFPSVPKSSIGASTLAKTSDREGDRVGRP